MDREISPRLHSTEASSSVLVFASGAALLNAVEMFAPGRCAHLDVVSESIARRKVGRDMLIIDALVIAHRERRDAFCMNLFEQRRL